MKKFKLLGIGLASTLVLAACGASTEEEATNSESGTVDKTVIIAASQMVIRNTIKKEMN